MTTCPTTSKAVTIGWELSKESFDASPVVSGTYLCSQCGELHHWIKKDAWVEE